MKTIAKIIHTKHRPLRIVDSKGNTIYFEDSHGVWYKEEYDSNGNLSYYEDLNGYWQKLIFNSVGNEVYFEDSDGLILDKRI